MKKLLYSFMLIGNVSLSGMIVQNRRTFSPPPLKQLSAQACIDHQLAYVNLPKECKDAIRKCVFSPTECENYQKPFDNGNVESILEQAKILGDTERIQKAREYNKAQILEVISSYETIKDCVTEPSTWLDRIEEIPTPSNQWLEAGEETLMFLCEELHNSIKNPDELALLRNDPDMIKQKQRYMRRIKRNHLLTMFLYYAPLMVSDPLSVTWKIASKNLQSNSK